MSTIAGWTEADLQRFVFSIMQRGDSAVLPGSAGFDKLEVSNLKISDGVDFTPQAKRAITSSINGFVPSNVVCTIRGAQAQAANLTEWRDAAGASLAFIGAGGGFTTGGGIAVTGSAGISSTGNITAGADSAVIGTHPSYSGWAAFYKSTFDYSLRTNGTDTYLNSPSATGSIFFRAADNATNRARLDGSTGVFYNMGLGMHRHVRSALSHIESVEFSGINLPTNGTTATQSWTFADAFASKPRITTGLDCTGGVVSQTTLYHFSASTTGVSLAANTTAVAGVNIGIMATAEGQD